MEFLIIWGLFGVAAAVVASNRGASGCLWFILGLLFGPFGLILAFFSGPKQICPLCKSKIHKEATVCPKCNRDIPLTEQDPIVDNSLLKVKQCKCGKVYELYAKFDDNNEIDEYYQSKRYYPFPENLIIKCDCGYNIDLSKLKNEIEEKTGKQIIF